MSSSTPYSVVFVAVPDTLEIKKMPRRGRGSRLPRIYSHSTSGVPKILTPRSVRIWPDGPPPADVNREKRGHKAQRATGVVYLIVDPPVVLRCNVRDRRSRGHFSSTFGLSYHAILVDLMRSLSSYITCTNVLRTRRGSNSEK